MTMTFKKFAEIAAAHRPDAVVHAHKSFCGVQDIAIYFKNPDGSHSKVYSYRGSYADVLNRLGVKVITETDPWVVGPSAWLAQLYSAIHRLDREEKPRRTSPAASGHRMARMRGGGGPAADF